MTTQELDALTAADVSWPTHGHPRARATAGVVRERVLLGLALVGFLLFVLPGGYRVNELGMGLALLTLLPALVATRAWRALGRAGTVVTGACIGSALVVLVATGSWRGTHVALFMVYAVLIYMLVAGYAVTGRRRVAVAVALSSVALLEFAIGWGSSLAAGDPSATMRGTLGHYNPFAALLLGPALLAATVFVRSSSPRLQVPAAITTALLGTGIVLSTSRAVLGLLVLGWLAVGYLAYRTPDRRAGVVRWLAIPALIAAGTYVLTCPLFFGSAHYSLPLIGEGGRGTSTMVGTNTARVMYVHAALQIFAHHPLFGAGFGTYPTAAAQYLPHGTRPIFGVYNIWIDGLTAGGVVYGVPLLAAGIGIALTLARAARRAWSSIGSVGDRVLTWGVVIGTVAVLGHFAFDADTYYPALMAAAAVLVGLAQACSRESR